MPCLCRADNLGSVVTYVSGEFWVWLHNALGAFCFVGFTGTERVQYTSFHRILFFQQFNNMALAMFTEQHCP